MCMFEILQNYNTDLYRIGIRYDSIFIERQ